MGGLARICKLYGGMRATSGGKTVEYVWDYVADEAVTIEEMPLGSERHAASERVRWSEGTEPPQRR